MSQCACTSDQPKQSADSSSTESCLCTPRESKEVLALPPPSTNACDCQQRPMMRQQCLCMSSANEVPRPVCQCGKRQPRVTFQDAPPRSTAGACGCSGNFAEPSNDVVFPTRCGRFGPPAPAPVSRCLHAPQFNTPCPPPPPPPPRRPSPCMCCPQPPQQVPCYVPPHQQPQYQLVCDPYPCCTCDQLTCVPMPCSCSVQTIPSPPCVCCKQPERRKAKKSCGCGPDSSGEFCKCLDKNDSSDSSCSCCCCSNVSKNNSIGCQTPPKTDPEKPWYKQCPGVETCIKESYPCPCNNPQPNQGKCQAGSCQTPLQKQAETMCTCEPMCAIAVNTDISAFDEPPPEEEPPEFLAPCCCCQKPKFQSCCEDINSFIRKFETPFCQGYDWCRESSHCCPGMAGDCGGSSRWKNAESAHMATTEILSLRRMLPAERRAYYRMHQTML